MQCNPNLTKEKKRCHSDDIVTIETIKDDAIGASDGQKKMETVILNAISNIATKVEQINERITTYRNQTVAASTPIQLSAVKKK